MFSKSDELVDWKSVLAHAQNAERNGTPVFKVELESSAHCAHIRERRNAERYWKAAKTAWQARRGDVICAKKELEEENQPSPGLTSRTMTSSFDFMSSPSCSKAHVMFLRILNLSKTTHD
jgi:hypothetical protein